MRYIIESICPEENLITLYYRFNLKDAGKWASFLYDNYHVDTAVYTEEEYMKLHPEKNFIE